MQAIDVHRMTYRVLDELPPELRVVLAMSDIDEVPMSEIAAVLEIPLGTAYTRLRAARRAFEEAWNQQRATSHRAVLPFMLWDASDLLHGARAIPNLAPEVTDAIWRDLVIAIGPSIAAAAAAGAAGAASGAPAAGTAKVATALAAKKVAGGVVAIVAGAGLVAALRSAPDKSPEPELRPSAIARHELELGTSNTVATAAPGVLASYEAEPAIFNTMTAASSAPVDQYGAPAASTATTTSIAPVVRAASPRPRTSARGVAKPSAATVSNVSERTWLQTARDALDRGDVAAARAALAHVESARFASERAALWRLVLAHQAGGP
jgi:hypothetical protein